MGLWFIQNNQDTVSGDITVKYKCTRALVTVTSLKKGWTSSGPCYSSTQGHVWWWGPSGRVSAANSVCSAAPCKTENPATATKPHSEWLFKIWVIISLQLTNELLSCSWKSVCYYISLKCINLKKYMFYLNNAQWKEGNKEKERVTAALLVLVFDV